MSSATENKRQPQTNGPIRSREELLELYRVVVEEASNKSSEEGFRDLIASGIYTDEGKLAKEYGG